MISIKSLIEKYRDGPPPDRDILEASLQMNRLILETAAQHALRGRDASVRAIGRALKELASRMDRHPTALDLLEIAGEATDAIDDYAHDTAEYLHKQNEQMQAMIAMLTDALADVSGQADASIAHLQAIEHEIEQATGLDDMRALRYSLDSCLASLREAVAHQRRSSASTRQRLHEKITVAQERAAQIHSEPEPDLERLDLLTEPADAQAGDVPAAYVAVFKLQRPEHITSRFGQGVKLEMLALVSRNLKSVLGPDDRLVRWKGASFLAFINSTAGLSQVRARLADAVATTGKHYVEAGSKTALLSVAVDWVVFPYAQGCPLDRVFAEANAFLSSEGSRGYAASHESR
ncbi:MAG: hypothetical protein KIT09_23725 [Bryobacteraceae bacterium]|nr:hypothetical protein [Bryobacteraceae bacterium]